MRLALAALALTLAAPLAQAQDLSLPPTYDTITLEGGFTPDPFSFELMAGGSTEVTAPTCVGNIADAPDLNLDWTGNGSTLYIYAQSEGDTTMLVNLPDGSWACDDDSFGNSNPLVVIENAPSGRYNLWSGTYSTELLPAVVMISEINPSPRD